jgi:hypothetical protein
MPFHLRPESSITLLIKELKEAEQAGAKLPAEARHLLSHAAHALDECRSHMLGAIEALEFAVHLRAGAMDSLPRHEEVARQKNLTMEEQAQFLGNFLNTPRATAATHGRPNSDQVL